HRPLFEVIFVAGLDKIRHPEVKAAEKPFEDAYTDIVRTLCADGTGDLAAAVEAAAYGHAMLLLEGDYGHGDEAVELAGDGAARATLALVESRHLLRRQDP